MLQGRLPMPRVARLVPLSRLFFLLFFLAGCDRAPAPGGASSDVPVPVAKPVERKVRDYVYYTGRTNAKDAVTIVPRVTGYLKKMPFKEGAEVFGPRVIYLPYFNSYVRVVINGTLLFEIDDRPYKAQLDAAKAAVAQNEESVNFAVATNKRFTALDEKQPGSVSKQELEQYQAQEGIAKANLKLALANLDSAKLNLDWTKLYSPIDGIISRYYLTAGNLVNQDVTQLTTLVRMDPMYANFDVDEPTLLKIKQAINEGKIADPQGGSVPVEMGLTGEEGFPHAGKVNFFDNQVNAGTGSISVRGEFDNHKPKGGAYLLLPGMFVRIRLPMGDEQDELLVKDSAVTSEQGRKYLYVIDPEGKVESRSVTLGSLQDDGLRVVRTGLKKDDWVLVGALQQVRPGVSVKLEPLQRMPTLGTPATPQAMEKKDKAKGKK
jgi:multidrug efflux system membrane fusion protein